MSGRASCPLLQLSQTTRVLNERAEDGFSRHQKQVDPQACRNTALQWQTKETRGMEHCGHDEFWRYRQRWLNRLSPPSLLPLTVVALSQSRVLAVREPPPIANPCMRERKRECREDVPVQRASSPERQTDKPVGAGCAWADSSTVRGWTKYVGRGSRVEKSRKGYRVPASR